MIFQDRNLYLRAVRNVELADKAEQERKIAEEYHRLQLLSQPSTNLPNTYRIPTESMQNEIDPMQITKPKRKNVKK